VGSSPTGGILVKNSDGGGILVKNSDGGGIFGKKIVMVEVFLVKK
jgi:hypothetical protein